MPSNKSIHTKKFDDCVEQVKANMRKYNYSGNPYSICMNSVGYKKSVKKAHRRK